MNDKLLSDEFVKDLRFKALHSIRYCRDASDVIVALIDDREARMGREKELRHGNDQLQAKLDKAEKTADGKPALVDDMEFLVLKQKPGESPGLMEVYGFYDSEEEAAAVVNSLKVRWIETGLYCSYEPEHGKVAKTKEGK